MVALNALEKAAMLAFLKSRRGDKVVYCVCRVCLSASRLPPMRIGSVGAWIRSSRLKAVAEATERVHQRPVLVLSPSVGELLPLCHYDYMMLLIPRSK